ncbi:MAG: RNA polymerase-associated protein RapA [Candidatus Delongbacteria bacterium]|nr:RNA polymerase-associated protein RapA [Candidatus Delongbacteria bacterium]MBN2835275.1 RNA polymerase-associated protein RapA [Candidatus Delongbacteria bacterium]
MDYNNFIFGQRWVSLTEPELGLGIILNTSNNSVDVLFPAASSTRKYNIESAPLRRVIFEVGKKIRTNDNREDIVIEIMENDGVLTYKCKNNSIHESEIADNLSNSEPMKKVEAGTFDNNENYKLRVESILLKEKIYQNQSFGYLSGKIELMPHQLYIADKVTSLPQPRALLSDDTGLGKTIEACLIIQKLILTKEIGRVLIIVPDQLVFQWLIELVQKFNLRFKVFDIEYIKAENNLTEPELSKVKINPFSHDQLYITEMNFLTSDKIITDFVLEGDWDLVVIDEIHNLHHKSKEYSLIRELSKLSYGMLLLTATPEKSSYEDHFFNLHLIDPEKYSNLEEFKKLENNYIKISTLIDKIYSKEIVSISNDEFEVLKSVSGKKSKREIETILSDSSKYEKLIDNIVDIYGSGRTIFRNMKDRVNIHSKKNIEYFQFDPNDFEKSLLKKEFNSLFKNIEVKADERFIDFAKVKWLKDFLSNHHKEKFLLICNSISKVKLLHRFLGEIFDVEPLMFHEEIDPVIRDKQVYSFMTNSDIKLLISSELGSEGRNFQFINNLILFDLPLNPELLQQRIGRIDRIGQIHKIKIFIPYYKNSHEEILLKWYNEGLNYFDYYIHGTAEIYSTLSTELIELITKFDETKLEIFLIKTKRIKDEISKKIRDGRDKLIEINSFNEKAVKKLLTNIKHSLVDKDFEEYILKLLDYYHFFYEETDKHNYSIDLNLIPDNDFPLPMVKDETLILSFSREKSLYSPYTEYITPEHFMVRDSLDLFLSSDSGNATIVEWKKSKMSNLVIELFFILETPVSRNLNVNKYLPFKPIRIVMDNNFRDLSEDYSFDLINSSTMEFDNFCSEEYQIVYDFYIPSMMEKIEKFADKKSLDFINLAKARIESDLDKEIDRYRKLNKYNNDIFGKEIDVLLEKKNKLISTVENARPRIECIRIVK